MDWKNKKVLVTGGAGFIGSHIVDELVSRGCRVTVVDNLRTGNKNNIEKHLKNGKVKLANLSLLDSELLANELSGNEFVFHLAANADIRRGIENTRIDLEQNTIATFNLIDAMRSGDVKKIVFFSSSAVYGEPDKFPTPENYLPEQTSLYGAAKYSCEALIEAYCNCFGFHAWVFRPCSILGERYSHGVVFDFVKKLDKNKEELEILGNGMQKKSFIYVKDAVDGVFAAIDNAAEKFNVFNIGSEKTISVKEIADIVVSELGLKNVKFKYTGGERGWKGDQKVVLLDVSKLKKLGWKQKVGTEDAVKKTVKWMKK